MDHAVTSLVGFARALRYSGMSCGPGRVQAFLAATSHVGLDAPTQVYWAGRLTLCSEHDDIARYDAAFVLWFGNTALPRPAAAQTQPRASRMAMLTNSGGQEEGADSAPIAAAASDAEVLRHRDMADLTPAEREHLRQMLAALHPEPPMRSALRRRHARRGAINPRATLRELLRAQGEPVRLKRHHRSIRPRRVVLLIDVSGSMTPYADALLRFAHVVMRRSPASTEVITLGTRMTRVTRQLRQRDADAALKAAGQAVPDFSGGTRLGETLRAFLDRWGQRGAARGAVVVVFSDGWERGDSSVLAEQMGRLRRLAHAVIWANPHAGGEGYEPVQSGIAVALPHVDQLVAGHSVRALQELWWWVRALAGGRSPDAEVRYA